MNTRTDTSIRTASPDGSARRRTTVAGWLLVALVALPCLVLIAWTGRPTQDPPPPAPPGGRAAYDMLRFHVPVVRTFAADLPTPDLTDYLSATTPGYHLLLAPIARLAPDALLPLRIAGLLPALLLAWIVALALARRTGDALAAATLAAPVAASSYLLLSGAFVLPDAAGWLGVALVLLVALRIAEGAFRPRWLLAGGLALLALAMVRQIHLWAAAALWTAAWWSAGGSGLGDALTTRVPTRVRRAAAMALATLPAFAVVGLFVGLWGGLTPPTFRGQYPPGLNPAAPAFVLAMTGALGLVFAGWWAPAAWASLTTRRDRAEALVGLTLAAALSLLAAVAVATSYDKDAGRWSGLWNLAQRLPAPAERSPLFVGLAVLGGVTIWAATHRLRAGVRWTLLAAGLAFIVAQAAGHELWQRYTEPMVLLWLGLALASGPALERLSNRDKVMSLLSLWRYAGPALFVAASIGLAFARSAPPASLGPIDPTAPLPWQTDTPALGTAPDD